jgi:hypothetical protein
MTWLVNRAAQRRTSDGEVPRDCTSVLMDITVV